MTSTARHLGRPCKLTEELTSELTELLEAGNPLDTSARAVGVAPSTLHRWNARGRNALRAAEEGEAITEEDALYVHLHQAVARARARSEVEALEVIRSAALSGTWQAAAWLLERRRPDLWGRHRLEAERDIPPEEKERDARGELYRLLGLS